MGIAEQRGGRQLFRGARHREQFQAGLVGQAVGLALVHVLGGPDEVFPGVGSAARAGHDVVQAALGGMQQAAGVLAAVAIALANGAGGKLRPPARHAGIVHRHNHGRHPDGPARRADGVVARANGQRDPFRPRHRPDVAVVGPADVQGRGGIRGELAEGIRRRANIDRLPVAIQHQYDGLVQYVVHKIFGPDAEVLVLG